MPPIMMWIFFASLITETVFSAFNRRSP